MSRTLRISLCCIYKLDHCTMSLQLSKSKPRQLHYAAGGLKEDFTLLEVDEALLETILHDQWVSMAQLKQDP